MPSDQLRQAMLNVPHPVHGTNANINPITNLPEVEHPDVPWGEAFASGLILSNPISGAIDRGSLTKPDFAPEPG